MAFWRNISPSGAIGDFIAVFRSAGQHRWRFMMLAALTTFGIFYVIAQEGGRGAPRPPKVIFIQSWLGDRSDKEIIAGNIANQKRKDAQAAEEARRAEEVRQIYKTVGRLSGMDVDAIEKKAAADRAAEGAAKAAAGMGQAQVPVAK
jgi:hypothetical protein